MRPGGWALSALGPFAGASLALPLNGACQACKVTNDSPAA